MTWAQFIQLKILLSYGAILIVTAPAAYRTVRSWFTPRPVWMFDSIKLFLMFVGLTNLYGFYVRMVSGGPSIWRARVRTLEWPLSAELVAISFLFLTYAVFRTEKAIYHAREP